jgi:hypothetical protein
VRDADIIDHLKNIEQKAYDAGKKVRTEIKNPNNDYDARVSTFFIIAQAVRWFKIFLILKTEYLDKQHWYDTIYLSQYRQQQPEIGYVPFQGIKGRGLLMPGVNDYHLMMIDEFNYVMLVAYSQVLYSIMESKFRLFLLALDQHALDKEDRFSYVYPLLLKKTRRKPKYRRLIRFFSFIRNTIHNNGKHRYKREPNVRMKYKGKLFKFQYDRMVKYPYPFSALTVLLLYITPDVIEMMEDIILNTKLKKIQSIPEPAAQP